MIPLYPPRQGDPRLQIVKWRSLVHLVSQEKEEAPRTRSLSTITFLSSTRKHSTTSQQAFSLTRKKSTEVRSSSLERRRPSAPSLIDLRRFLPNIIHHRRRASSKVIVDEGGRSIHDVEQVLPSTTSSHLPPPPQNQRPDTSSAFGAKNKVQRLKAAATSTPKESTVAGLSSTRSNFFTKNKGRKQFTVEQSTVIVSAAADTSTTVVHGSDATLLTTPEAEPGNARKFPQYLDQSILQTELVDSIVSSASLAADRKTDEEEDPITVVIDPSGLLAGFSTIVSRHKGEVSTLITNTERRSFNPDCSPSGQEEVDKHSVVESSFPEAFNPVLFSLGPRPQSFNRPEETGQTKGKRSLTSIGSTAFSSSFHPQASSKQLHVSASSNHFNLPRPHYSRRYSFPLTQRYFNRNSGCIQTKQTPSSHRLRSNCSPHLRHHDNQQSAELFGRRFYSLPDMVSAGMVICGTDELHNKYRGRIEKVKFGVPINEAFSHDIPATLLVLLLKVNKEGPLKKDIWRAPGNQAQVRKLSHIMQHGRLVNISHISVYTAASVIKKFLSKLPGGIFGPENEQQLFNISGVSNNEEQRQIFCRVICSLSVPSQHLLVLLFGTFRIIADSAETFNTRMTPDAIGISVAPSLFHTCMHDEQRAKLEDVMRFKLASQVISKIIQGFGYTNLFPRECYEFYARITGRTLRVDEHWQFSFAYPSRVLSQPSICFGQKSSGEAAADEKEDQPGPSGLQRQPSTSTARRRSEDTEGDDVYGELPGTSSRFIHPQRDRAASASGTQLQHTRCWGHSSRDPFSDLIDQRQLSTSMGEVLLHSDYERSIGEFLSDRPSGQPSPYSAVMSSRCVESLESTRSLTYLEWVHEKQTRRMRTRSEWFLTPIQKNNGASKSFDFHFGQSSLVQQLKLPETDTEMSLQSSSEEMRVGEDYQHGADSNRHTSSSHSSSIKEQRPLSPILIVESSLEPMVRKVEEMVMLSGESTPRLPFQIIQHSGDDDDALLSTPPARQQPPVFFAEDAPPAKAPKSSPDSSSAQLHKNILVGPSSSGQRQETGLTRVSSVGVVRRKSLRQHYVRPNKSLDQEGTPKEEAGATSHSTPAASITRRGSTSGEDRSQETSSTRTVLVRRKSSNSAQFSKIPVQTRRST